MTVLLHFQRPLLVLRVFLFFVASYFHLTNIPQLSLKIQLDFEVTFSILTKFPPEFVVVFKSPNSNWQF